MTFERTSDVVVIRSIATHPKVWPTMADDLASDPEKWQPVIHDGVWYVLVHDPDPCGLFVFFPENSVCWQVHICMLPKWWGKATRAAKEVFEWLWACTRCERIACTIPVWNAPAICCALRAGMKPFGVNQHSSLKNSRLHHQLLLGISKPAEIV